MRATRPLHFGQVFTGAAVIGLELLELVAALAALVCIGGHDLYPSRISAGNCAFSAAFTFSWKPFAASSVSVPVLER